MDDLISRQAVLDCFNGKVTMPYDMDTGLLKVYLQAVVDAINNLPSAEKTGWIPVKWHTITAEERERESYPEEWVNHVDCVMPEDEQEILITVKDRKGNTWVEKDTCYIDDGFYLDSGYDWIEDVLAWCELPTPYKAQEGGQDEIDN